MRHLQLTLLLLLGLLFPLKSQAAIQLQIGDTTATLSTLTLNPLGGGQYQYTNSALSIGGVNFDVTIDITTNSPGTLSLAQLLTIESTIRARGAGGDSRDVYIQVTDDTFTMPTGTGLTLESSFSGTVGPHNGNDPQLISYVLDSSNAVLQSVTNSLGASGSATVDIANTPFTLRNLTYVRLNPNAEASTTSSTEVQASVPVTAAPELASSITWAILASGGLGLCCWKRR